MGDADGPEPMETDAAEDAAAATAEVLVRVRPGYEVRLSFAGLHGMPHSVIARFEPLSCRVCLVSMLLRFHIHSCSED